MNKLANNESHGITFEKIICDVSNIEFPFDQLHRVSDMYYTKENIKLVTNCLNKIPKIVKYTGNKDNKVDFLNIDNNTISVKTAKKRGFMICPQIIGQASKEETLTEVFGKYVGNVNKDTFKKMILEYPEYAINIYLSYTFDCDYTLVFFPIKNLYKIIKKNEIKHKYKFKKEYFSFTQNYDSWNESCSIKYNDITIGNSQIHQNRKSYKFRFNLENILSFVGDFYE